MKKVFFFAFFLALNLIGSKLWAAENLTPLGFQEAYRKILDLSLRVDTQKNQIDIAKAQSLKPLGQFTPQLSLVFKEMQAGDPRVELRPLNLLASMNLFRFGADALELKSSKLNSNSQAEKLRTEKMGAEEDALFSLFTLIRLQSAYDVFLGISNSRSELVRIAEERYHKGLLAQQEVDKIRIDFENAKAREADAFNELEDAKSKVASQLGAEWASKVWPWTEKLKSIGARFAEEFKIENHPLYVSAQLSEAAAQNYARAQQRKLLPSIDLSFSYGSADLTNTTPLGSANTYAGSLALSLPLFEQFNSYSNYKQAESLSAQASSLRSLVVRELAPQFETSKKRWLNSLDSTLRRERNLAVSRKLYEDNFSRFKQGRVSVNDLLIDQTRLSDAELLAIEAWFNLHVNYERLCHAKGFSVGANASCEEK